MLDINELRHLCHDKNIAITKHANNRLKERNISIDNIKSSIQSGEIICQYEDDKPFPIGGVKYEVYNLWSKDTIRDNI